MRVLHANAEERKGEDPAAIPLLLSPSLGAFTRAKSKGHHACCRVEYCFLEKKSDDVEEVEGKDLAALLVFLTARLYDKTLVAAHRFKRAIISAFKKSEVGDKADIEKKISVQKEVLSFF